MDVNSYPAASVLMLVRPPCFFPATTILFDLFLARAPSFRREQEVEGGGFKQQTHDQALLHHGANESLGRDFFNELSAFGPGREGGKKK